jgi:signal transduction histidine kinase
MNSQDIRSLWQSFAPILLLISAFALYLLIKPGNQASVTLVDNLTQGLLEGVGLLLALPLFLPGGKRMKLSPEPLPQGPASVHHAQRWIPFLLSLGILSYVIGQALWTYNENIAHLPVLFPSWADAGFLGSYPLILLALLLLPSSCPLSAETRTRIILDGLLIVVGVMTLGWYFILGPTMLQGADTLAGQIVGTAYPFATLVLFFYLILLNVHINNRVARPVMGMLSLALLVIATTDSIYDYQELHNLHTTDGLLDIGWPLGYMLIGLAARAIRLYPPAKDLSNSRSVASIQAQQTASIPSLWCALLPYLFVPAVVLLLIYIECIGTQHVLKAGVFIGAAILMALLLLRQTNAIRETIMQNKTLRMMQQDVSAKNDALNAANVQLEEQAKQLDDAYKQKFRLNELKDQFLLHINHELRTPLTTMQGNLELLQLASTQLPGQNLMFLQNALESCEELSLVVNNALDVVSIDGGRTPHCEQLSVAATVRDVLAQFNPRKVAAYQVYTEICEELHVWADLQFLRQVLQNLLSNAFKFAPEQTPIIINAALYDDPAQEQHTRPRIYISVKDAGPGITPDECAQLFDKFVRLKRDHSGPITGSGLGLYICKLLVESMHGQIWVESTGVEGEGSRFCFTLFADPPITPDAQLADYIANTM